MNGKTISQPYVGKFGVQDVNGLLIATRNGNIIQKENPNGSNSAHRLIFVNNTAYAGLQALSKNRDQAYFDVMMQDDNSDTCQGSNGVKTEIDRWSMPEYGAGIGFTATNNYRAPKNGYAFFSSHSGNKFYLRYVYVNDVEVLAGHSGDYANWPVIIPIQKGSLVRISDGNYSAIFYPCIGG